MRAPARPLKSGLAAVWEEPAVPRRRTRAALRHEPSRGCAQQQKLRCVWACARVRVWCCNLLRDVEVENRLRKLYNRNCARACNKQQLQCASYLSPRGWRMSMCAV